MTTYAKCACEKCGRHIEFPAEMEGESAQCPDCGQMTTLGGAVPEPPVVRKPKMAPVKRSKLTGFGMILGLLGWAILIPSGILFLGLMVAADKNNADAGLTGVFIVLGLVLGIAFIVTAKRCNAYMICPHCGNKLTSDEAKICAVCRGDIA